MGSKVKKISPAKKKTPNRFLCGKPGWGRVTPMSDAERVQGQIDRGEVWAGPDAAREIARRIEDSCGYWKIRQMDLRSRPDSYIAPVVPKMAA